MLKDTCRHQVPITGAGQLSNVAIQAKLQYCNSTAQIPQTDSFYYRNLTYLVHYNLESLQELLDYFYSILSLVMCAGSQEAQMDKHFKNWEENLL